MLSILRLSQLLIVLFVSSVTLWYCVTPYIVGPHPEIINDVLSKSKLTPSPTGVPEDVDGLVSIENWTKWRLYVNSSHPRKAHDPQIVYGSTKTKMALEEKAVINMEWRSDYEVHLTKKSPSELSVGRLAPPAGDYGIYDHFVAESATDEDSGPTVRIVPRFLFGLSYDTIEEMYGKDVSKFPVIGVFTSSPRFDRILIQAYMNIVTLSVIFLLYANNPPHAVLAKKKV